MMVGTAKGNVKNNKTKQRYVYISTLSLEPLVSAFAFACLVFWLAA